MGPTNSRDCRSTPGERKGGFIGGDLQPQFGIIFPEPFVVTISVDGKSACRQITKVCVEDAVGFMLPLLIREDPQMLEELEIHISFKSRVCKGQDLAGGVFIMDTYRSPSQFDVIIDSSKNWNDTFRTLGHELVHVKQLALSEWALDPTGKVNRWLGQLINVDNYHYFDLPWEIDAYGREEGLLLRFNDYHDNKQAKPLIEVTESTRLILATMTSPSKINEK